MHMSLKQVVARLITCWTALDGGACRLPLDGRQFRQLALALDLADMRVSLSLLNKESIEYNLFIFDRSSRGDGVPHSRGCVDDFISVSTFFLACIAYIVTDCASACATYAAGRPQSQR